MKTKLFLLLGASLVSFGASAHDFEALNADGITIYYNKVDSVSATKTAEVTFKGTWYGATAGEYVDTVNIPNQAVFGGVTYKVVGIGEQAFAECYDLKSVTIPENIEYFKSEAFSACYNLKEVNYNAINCADFALPSFAPFSYGNMAYGTYVYPGGDKTQSWESYWSKYELRTINIGASVVRIPDYMFYGLGGRLTQASRSGGTLNQTHTTEGVTAINFAGTPVAIGNSAFRSCPVLETLNIPAGVQSLGIALFSDCDTLQNVQLPSSLTEISSYMFSGCRNLATITVPANVERISYEAFKDCAKLTTVVLPDQMKVVGGAAFRNCDGLTTITLPNALEKIEGYAFSDCSSLTSIVIPASVAAISNHAFEDCVSLSTFTLQGSPTMGEFLFKGCLNLSQGQFSAPAAVPAITPTTFYSVANTMQVNVPVGSENAYMEDANWQRFFAPADVPVNAVENVSVVAAEQALQFGNVNQARVMVMDAAGRCIYNQLANGSFTLSVPSNGLYMVKIGNQTRKVLVP